LSPWYIVIPATNSTQEIEKVKAIEEGRTAELVDNSSDGRLDMVLAVLLLVYVKILVLLWTPFVLDVVGDMAVDCHIPDIATLEKLCLLGCI